MQESLFIVPAYERRVRKPVCAREIGERQQCPGTELPTRRILTVHYRGAGGYVHLLAVRRKTHGDLAFNGEVAGQTPDFLLPADAVEDEIPIVILAVGFGTDV